MRAAPPPPPPNPKIIPMAMYHQIIIPFVKYIIISFTLKVLKKMVMRTRMKMQPQAAKAGPMSWPPYSTKRQIRMSSWLKL